MTRPSDITALRIDVLTREIATLKASARERMHDSSAIAAIAHRLKVLDAEIRMLRRARLTQRPIGRVVLRAARVR